MWSAAATSAAFAAHSARQAVQVGLSEIPAECRLAELVRQLDEAHEGGQAAPDTVEEVMKQYRSHSALHVLSNAAAAVIGLLWGDGDFSRTIGLTVQAGQDTVGNAAVAGGVCGALVGEGAIAEHWTEPFNDSMETALTGPSPLSISELVERTRHVQDRLATGGQAGK
jgi:ADP-ribosylglycohydrolase